MRLAVAILILVIALSKTYLQETVDEAKAKAKTWVVVDPEDSQFIH